MLYSDSPPLRPFSEVKPTLLISWWITLFCTWIILLRLAGRHIRVGKLFRADKIVALALVPLFLRMGCAHIVLFWGTNNVELNGTTPFNADLSHLAAESRVALAGRVFYAATSVFSSLKTLRNFSSNSLPRLWTLKLTTLEFFTHLAKASMKKSPLRSHHVS